MAKVIAAGIFLVNKDNQLLICHPTNHNPNFWSIPKGKVEKGETLIDAAIRETHEETNIDLSKAIGLKELEGVNYKSKKKILHPFLAWEPAMTGVDWYSFELKCNSNVSESRGGFPEMDDYKFVSLDEAINLLHETQVACIDVIKKIIGSIE